MKTRLWKFVGLAHIVPWLRALFERVIFRQKTVFLGPLKSPKICSDNNNNTLYSPIQKLQSIREKMNDIKIKGYQLLEITKKLTSSGSWFEDR